MSLIGVAAPAARAGTFEGTVRQISLMMPSASLRPAVTELSSDAVFAISDERMAELAHAAGSGAQITEAVIKIKGSKFRVDVSINNQPGFLLVDSAVDTTWLVSPASRSYVEWTRADSEAAARKAESGSKAKDLPSAQAGKGPAALGPTPVATQAAALTELKESAIVNDAESTAFELREGNVVSRGWVTAEHPELLAALRAASETQRHRRSTALTPMELFADKGLPMKVQTLRGDRYEEIHIVEIKAEPVPDDLFRVPSDYTKVDPNATKGPTPAPTPKGP